jgi:PmbA protein
MQLTKTETNLLTTEQAGWQELARDILKQALAQGASSAEVGVSSSNGFSVSVRLGEVETVEYNRDKGLGITVYFGQRKGSASTSDTRPEAIQSTVTAACHIAKLSGEDEYAGLADPALLAKSYPDLALYYPWSIDPEQAIELAKNCEAQARAFDKRITNSEGASVASHQGLSVYATTDGFMGGYLTSRHSFNCAVVAQDSAGMQRDGSYTVARDPLDLENVSVIAKEAGERTVKRLGARRIKTCQVPVIFQAEVARGLIGSFLGAISGGNLYRKASFLLDQLGQPVFAKHIHIYQRPHILKALGSAPFDSEGVRTCDNDLIKDGILANYILGSYSARKLGLQSTGNAGGAHNIFINNGDQDLPGLLQSMGKGLLVTDVMGQGVNMVTGDYSRGATGFWVENGVIQHAVEEITIAGNLREMYQQIITVGNDIDKRGSIQTGSILLENMMVAGD